MECFANLCKNGSVVFSPILMCHEACVTHDLPSDALYWQHMNTQFLRRCDKVFVLCIPGWAKSKGVRQEISLARQLNLPVVYIDVSTAPIPLEELPA